MNEHTDTPTKTSFQRNAQRSTTSAQLIITAVIITLLLLIVASSDDKNKTTVYDVNEFVYKEFKRFAETINEEETASEVSCLFWQHLVTHAKTPRLQRITHPAEQAFDRFYDDETIDQLLAWTYIAYASERLGNELILTPDTIAFTTSPEQEAEREIRKALLALERMMEQARTAYREAHR
ncbi:hypothetical protein JXA12_02210 [Candidatus Woesearchaeota archaeon]|nr:hypothetical protein [Candidatus Woesearchaeota archaeon]